MEKIKSKSKWIWLIVILLAAILVFGIYKYTASKKVADEALKSRVENVVKRAPESDAQKKEREKIKEKFEDAIVERYKGDGYGVEVFRSSENSDELEATIQLDYNKFTEKESCEFVAEKFLKEIIGTKNIKSIDIHFGYKDELKCSLVIDDFQTIKSESDIDSILKSDKFRFIEKSKDTNSKDEKSKDDNKDNKK